MILRFVKEFIVGLIFGYRWARAWQGAEGEYKEAREIGETLGPWRICKDHDLERGASLEEIAEALAAGYEDEAVAFEGAMDGFEVYLRGDEPDAVQGTPSITRLGRGWGKRGR